MSVSGMSPGCGKKIEADLPIQLLLRPLLVLAINLKTQLVFSDKRLGWACVGGYFLHLLVMTVGYSVLSLLADLFSLFCPTLEQLK